MRTYLIFFALLLSSCRTFQRKDLTLYKQFNGNTQGLKINGVYFNKITLPSPNGDSHAVYYIMLYLDGTAAGFTHILTSSEMPMDSVTRLLFSDLQNRHVQFLKWGAYNIGSDRKLEIQRWTFKNGSPLDYAVSHMYGEVISDTSFVISFSKNGKRSSSFNSTFYYYPLKNKPDSTNWMMSDRKLNKKKH